MNSVGIGLRRHVLPRTRICWARTADIPTVSVPIDDTTVTQPRDATLLQRG